MAYEIQHPHWGSNRDHQVSASYLTPIYDVKVVTEVYQTFFGKTKTREKREQVLRQGTPDDNDPNARRRFQHRCGLLKIAMTPGRYGPRFVAFFDGHVASVFEASEMSFRFAADELNENNGRPIAEIEYWGKGTRRDWLNDYNAFRLVCTFANQEQMNDYLDLTNRPMPKSINHNGIKYEATNTGMYRSNDGMMLATILVFYYLLSAVEQQHCLENNPELRDMVVTPSNEVGSGGDSVASGAPPNGADYGGGDYPGGSPSGGDFGGGDYPGGSPSGGDFGGDFGGGSGTTTDYA